MKRCAGCKLEKDESQYRTEHKEEVRLYNKIYQIENKDKISAQSKIYTQEHKKEAATRGHK